MEQSRIAAVCTSIADNKKLKCNKKHKKINKDAMMIHVKKKKLRCIIANSLGKTTNFYD